MDGVSRNGVDDFIFLSSRGNVDGVTVPRCVVDEPRP